MTTIFEVLHRHAEPYKITLTRGQRGAYGWEISVSAVDAETALNMLRIADMRLRSEYGTGEAT